MKFKRKYYELIVKVDNDLEKIKHAVSCGATAILLDNGIDNINEIDEFCDDNDVLAVVFEDFLKLDHFEDVMFLDSSLDKSFILDEANKTDKRVVLMYQGDSSDIKSYRNLMLDGFLIDYSDNLEEYANSIQSVIFHPEKYDLFVVDFDGTIVDTMPMWRHICADFIKSENILIEEDVNQLVKSLTNSQIAELLQRKYLTHLTLDEVMNKLVEFIRVQYRKQKIKPGAENLLKELRKHGKVILYSATESSLLLDLLNIVGIKDLFDGVYSGSDLGLTKADGSGYIEVIKMVDSNSKPLILEDAPHAILGASMQKLDILAISDFSNKDSFDLVAKHATYFMNLNKEI